MRSSALFLLPALSSALPSFLSDKRDLLGQQLTNIVDDVEGLLGSIASEVDPDNYRPEPGYVFQEPGPGDSRGPCPGLNLLANYGYLPRNGYISASQAIEAVARGFNMGTDLAVILAVFAVLTDGDLETESWYLGTDPNGVGGLNRHSTVEVDISPNKEDYYNGCGNNHAISSRIFKQNVGFVAQDSSKEFSYDVMAKQYSANGRFSQQYNPYLYYFPFPSIVSVVAFNFYPEYFSNGTFGAGGVANYESISSIVGAKLNKKTGNFEYVAERWPEQGWYRRATGYGAVEALTDGFTRIYPANPVAMPIAQLGTPNLNVTTILCDVYQGLGSVVPLEIGGEYKDAAAITSWLLGFLTGYGLENTLLGCPPRDASTDYLYANSSQTGGALNPPPSVQKNAGNNVYNKTYFCEAPTTPNCQTTC